MGIEMLIPTWFVFGGLGFGVGGDRRFMLRLGVGWVFVQALY